MNNDVLISEVETKLNKFFNTEHIKIVDDSENHVGHSGNTGGAHLCLEIVANCFEELTRIERHKLIYKCLDGFIPQRIHALKVLALSPTEIKNLYEKNPPIK